MPHYKSHPFRFLPGLALPLLMLLLAACSSNPAADIPIDGAVSSDASTASLGEPALALEYHILAGELAVQRGDREVAAREYVAALAYSNDAELAQRATRVALFAEKIELAYTAVRAWTVAEPESFDAQKIAARLALRNGKSEGLSQHAEGVISQHPSGIAAGFKDLADVLSGDPEQGDLALEVMQARVAAHPDVAQAYYAQGLLALRYNQLEIANQSIQQALALKPDWGDAVLLRAGILVRQGRIDEASDLVQSLGGSASDRAEYHLNYARLLLDASQTAEAADQFDRVLEINPDNTDARYGLGLLALSLDQVERAEQAFEMLYASNQRQDDSAYYLGNIAQSRKNYTAARKWYLRVNSGSHVFDARVLAAHALYETGDLPAARAELRQLRQANPELADRLALSEAEILFDAADYDSALTVYNQAIETSPYDADLLYARSLVYERMNRYEDAEADLEAILEREPDNARALNALGYMLTNHSEDYDQALSYISQALEAEPENPAVIDSMGWVQYRLGNLQEARKHLQQAHTLLPDPEVAAHLGEILWQLGEQQQARDVWEKGLAENPGNTVLRETVDRLTP